MTLSVDAVSETLRDNGLSMVNELECSWKARNNVVSLTLEHCTGDQFTSSRSKHWTQVWRIFLANMSLLYDQCLPDGWTEDEKRQEMQGESIHYMLAINGAEGQVCAYVSFECSDEEVVDSEDLTHSALYCYELQTEKSLIGRGIGSWLLGCLEVVASHFGIDCIMLTCFKSNPAMEFYKKHGYEIDPSSPSLYLQSSTEYNYEIMSKVISTG